MRTGFAEEFWQLARFCSVGVVATVVHIGVAMMVVAGFGVGPTFAAVIGFAAAFMVSYLGHFRFSFAVSGRYRDYVLKFGVSSLASFLLSTTTVWLSTTLFGIDYKPALAALAIIVPACNYLMNRFWVFLHPGEDLSPSLEVAAPEIAVSE